MDDLLRRCPVVPSVGEGPAFVRPGGAGEPDRVAPGAERLEQAGLRHRGRRAREAAIVGGATAEASVPGHERGDRVDKDQAHNPIAIAAGEQMIVQPSHGVADQQIGARLAGLGQQALQVVGDGEAVAWRGSGRRQAHAGAVIGQRS